MPSQPLPYDPECPHCGWPHTMKSVADALVCRCDQAMWWMFDLEKQEFRLVIIGSRGPEYDQTKMVRYWHPEAEKFIGAFDRMLEDFENRRHGRYQRWSETAEPYDEALWQEGADQ